MISKLRESFNKPYSSVSTNSAALVIAFAGVLSRFLGLLRDRILASHFGAGDMLDIYYAAFRIPDLVYNLLILGALSAAFIPVFTGLLAHEKKEEAWKLANGLLSLTLIALVVICTFLAFFAPLLMKIITPGFSEEKISEVVHLTRIMFLSPIFLGISGIFGGILNSFKRFFIYSLSPILYNIGIILGAVYFFPIFGLSGLAWGVVLGALLHMTVQYPAVSLNGFKVSLLLNLQNPNLRRVLKLMIPRTMGLAVTQVNLLVVTIIASTLNTGSLAIFTFANNLQSFPLGAFAIPFALAVFPTLAHHWAKKERKDFIESFSRAMRQILFFIIPASIILIVLRAQIVRVVLGSGKFDWEDTTLTLQALGVFSLSLFAQGLLPLLARSFYAIHNTKTPFLTGIASEVINLILAIFLAARFGVIGLVWAFSISSIVNASLLFFILKNKMGWIDEEKILSVTLKILFSSIFAGIITQIVKFYSGYFINIDTFWAIFLQLIASGFSGILLYFALVRYFKLEEFESVKKLISGGFLRQKQPLPEDPTEASGM